MARPKRRKLETRIEGGGDPSIPWSTDGTPRYVIERYSRESGTGTIDEITRGKYRYFRGRIYADDSKGVRRRIEVTGKSRAEVTRKLKEVKEAPARSDVKKLTLGAFLEDQFLPGIKKQVKRGKLLSPNTYASYEKAIRVHVVPDMGKARLVAVTAANVDAWLDDLEAGPRAKQQAFTVLKRAFNYAIDTGVLTVNPIARVNAPEARKREQRVLTVEEVKKLLAAAQGTEWYALIFLAAVTAMRQGELFGLTWNAVHLDDAYLRVTKALRNGYGGLELAEPKTESSVRRIELPKEAVAVLTAHRAKQTGKPNEHNLVFPNSGGGFVHRDNFAKRTFKELLKTAGLPAVSFHSIRHSSNSALAASGTSLKVLQQRLGHSTASTTFAVYTHAAETEGRAAATTIGKLLGGENRGGKRSEAAQRSKPKVREKTI
jgi:integrase